ncbi:hypothetical protein P308_09875 [Pseudomonas piscis]|nr:hypothetical protein P308_09875 [Pseudomonas piscis]
MVSKARLALTTIFEPALRGVEPSSSMMVTSTQGSPWFCRSARALIQSYMFTSTSLLCVRASSRASLAPPGKCHPGRSQAARDRRAWV